MAATLEIVRDGEAQQTQVSETSTETSSARFRRISNLVEDELQGTLAYLNSQIEKIEQLCQGHERFDKGVFEAKKMVVEQKVNVLTRLSALSIDRVKMDTGDDNEIKDITSLF